MPTPSLPSLHRHHQRCQPLRDAGAKEKNAKHLPGCVALERVFLPIVFSSLGGLSPPEAVHKRSTTSRSLFVDAYAAELLGTSTIRHTAHLRTLLLQSLLASLASSAADMASALTSAAAAQPAAAQPAVSDPCVRLGARLCFQIWFGTSPG